RQSRSLASRQARRGDPRRGLRALHRDGHHGRRPLRRLRRQGPPSRRRIPSSDARRPGRQETPTSQALAAEPSYPPPARMFRKVLVANRGEIAVRIARTLREMGIASVAVYSDVDRTSRHVRMADEAHPIGPAPAAESYLRIDRILETAKRARADAIHPGYGFLSENPDFAEACEKAGIVFIGPSPMAMRAMGNKPAARERMATAGVPIVPGGPARTIEEAAATANGLGYPVMLKAAAGGGGKGMRLVEREADL